MISRDKLIYSIIIGFLLAALTIYLLAGGAGGSAVRYESGRFQTIAGQGVLTQSGLELIAPDSSTGQVMVIVPLDQPINAADYPMVSFKVPGLERASGAGIFWITAADPSRGHPMPLTLDQVRTGLVSLEGSPQWRGQVVRIGLVVQGPWSGQVTFRELGVLPRDVRMEDVAARWFRQWIHWAPWDAGASNFYVGAERSERRVTPVVFVSLWVLLACLVYLAWRGDRPLWVVAALVLGGWSLLDLRWQIDLWQRHGVEEPDAVLVADQRRRETLSQFRATQIAANPDARVFVISGDPIGYAVYRTRYHLGATNTSFGLDRLPSITERRAGDYLIVFGLRDRLEYVRSRGVIESSTESIPVDLIANSPETGGIFRIRAGG
jgi:hypothetical protein